MCYKKRKILKTDINRFLRQGLKLNIGCGDKKFAGYLNIDTVPTEATDVVMDVARDLHLIPSDIAEEIRLDNVFEHFYRYQQPQILAEFYRILQKEGKLIINWLPDFEAIIDAYLHKKSVRPGKVYDLFQVYRHTHGDPVPSNSPQQLHKDVFTRDSIRELLQAQGFYIERLCREIYPGEELDIGINIIAVKK